MRANKERGTGKIPMTFFRGGQGVGQLGAGLRAGFTN